MTVSTPTATRRGIDRWVPIAGVVDVIAVVAFVAIGRRSHDDDRSLLGIAAPFLIGLAVGWVLARAWRAPTRLATVLIVWPVTVLAGALLRRFAFERSTAASFIVVTAIVTGVFLIGWRAAANALRRRTSTS